MYSILGPAWTQLGSSMSGYMCPFSVMLIVAELMGTPYALNSCSSQSFPEVLPLAGCLCLFYPEKKKVPQQL